MTQDSQGSTLAELRRHWSVIRGAQNDMLNGRADMDALEEIALTSRLIDEVLDRPADTNVAVRARKVIQATLDDRVTNRVTSDVRAAHILLALESAGFRLVGSEQ